MNWGVVGAMALLLIWAVAALVMESPGWVHLLLTVGVQWGTVGLGGAVDIVKKIKSARIERVE